MAQIQVLSRKSGRKYRVQFMKNGKRIGKVFSKKKDAERFLAQLTIDGNLANSLTNITLTSKTLSDAIQEYLGRYIGKDLNSLKPRLNWWDEQLGTLPLGKVTKQTVRTSLKILESKGRAPATLNRYRAALSAIFVLMCDEYDLDHNPAKEVRQRQENNARTRFLSDEEIGRLLSVAKHSKWDRLYLLTLMAITTGARRSELIGLRWSDIDFESRAASLAETKNGQPRVLPLTVDVVQVLQRFREVGGGFVFPHRTRLNAPCTNFDCHWRAALEQAAIIDFRFHDLRHTAASILAKSGASLLEIAEVLGHKSITMTQRYSHLCIDHKTSLIDRVMGDISHG